MSYCSMQNCLAPTENESWCYSFISCALILGENQILQHINTFGFHTASGFNVVEVDFRESYTHIDLYNQNILQ